MTPRFAALANAIAAKRDAEREKRRMITAEQRKTRLSYAGSSDAPAILGVDPYRSAADVWLEKTGRVDGFEGNEHTDRGTLLEPALLDWAEKEIGRPFDRQVMRIAADGLRAANFDGICWPRETPGAFTVEAKTACSDEEWGDDGTDQVPDRVLIQAHHQFDIAGPAYRTCYVPMLVPVYRKFDFRLYVVPRNDDLVRVVAESTATFMRDFVRADRQPDDFKPSMEVLKRMKRVPNKVVGIADEIIDAWIACQGARKQAGDDEEAAKLAVLMALGDADGATFSTGSLTYLETTRKAHEVKASTYRTLRRKSAKK